MLVSPIAVPLLCQYFGIEESELLIRKARVEIAIHQWVLESSPKPDSGPPRVSRILRSLSRAIRTTVPVPEWKKQRPRAGRVWAADEDAALLRDQEAGLTLEEIAKRLGRGVFAVEVRLCKLGHISVPAIGSATRSDTEAMD